MVSTQNNNFMELQRFDITKAFTNVSRIDPFYTEFRERRESNEDILGLKDGYIYCDVK